MSQVIVIALGYLGVIPFVVAALFALFDLSLLGFDPRQVFIAYSAVILSFLGGIMWGRVLGLPDHRAVRCLLLLSNAIALTSFAALLLAAGGDNADGAAYLYALPLLMCGYVITLVVERLAYQRLLADVQRSYFPMRVVLTTVVVIMHIMVLVFESFDG